MGLAGGFSKVRGQADWFWSAGVQVTLPVGVLGWVAGADAENLLPGSCLPCASVSPSGER